MNPHPPEEAADLARALGVPLVVAALLLERGCADETSAQRFLHPSLDDLPDPRDLPNIEPACIRIAQAIERGEKIWVHGDYDVDGVCAAALLTRTLKTLKADVEVFVPHRMHDGYDLRTQSVKRAHELGVRLIVTVDCGIVAHDAVDAARELGIDLIVTDHHLPGADLPAALAVVSPKIPGSRYPESELCGTAIAYKLATHLLRHMGVRSKAFTTAYLDLVALATVADCMPLVGENRILVKHGLDRLKVTRNSGLRALMSVAFIKPDTLNAGTLGFSLGPRINAAGRIDAADHALRLLISDDPGQATELAERLEGFNRERQMEQERVYAEAVSQAQRFLDDRIMVVGSRRWHPGVIGIVASRLVETFGRPAVLVSIDEAGETARGSARSIPGFHIFEALAAAGPILRRSGGHKGAAGFDMDPSQLDELRIFLRDYSYERLPPELLEQSLTICGELSAADVTYDLARHLSRLEPFGHGNPRPTFVTRNLSVRHQSLIAPRGKSDVQHLKLVLAPETGRHLPCIGWRQGNRASQIAGDRPLDVCYEIEIEEFGGYRTVRLKLTDFQPAAAPGSVPAAVPVAGA